MYVVIRQNLDEKSERALTVLGSFKRAREAAECIAEDVFEFERYHDSEGACTDTLTNL